MPVLRGLAYPLNSPGAVTREHAVKALVKIDDSMTVAVLA